MKCGNCDQSYEDHCPEFRPKTPEGCQCDPFEWDQSMDSVPEVCDEFHGNKFCITCEHDEACHSDLAEESINAERANSYRP